MEVARTVHGFEPQTLIEKISRERIFQSPYWKEECFDLDTEGVVKKALELDHIGGMYGAAQKPTPFICLLLKMLLLLPSIEIALEFIAREKFKYVRCLGAVYVRLVGDGIQGYKFLEPLLLDYRKVKMRNSDGTLSLIHVDEFIHNLLTDTEFLGISLPRLPKRMIFEKEGKLESRRKIVEDLGIDIA